MLGLVRPRCVAWRPLVTVLALSSAFASAQASSQTLAAPPPPPPVKTTEVVREGTEIKVRLNETLSSKTATAGDTFGVTLDEGIKLPDGVEIPAGFHGKGEVTEAHKVEMMGKAGELNFRLDYIRVGDVRIHLRGSQGSEGKSMQSTAIALSLLVSPLFLMRHGHDMVYPAGQKITAYVDEDASIPLPIPAPPNDD